VYRNDFLKRSVRSFAAEFVLLQEDFDRIRNWSGMYHAQAPTEDQLNARVPLGWHLGTWHTNLCMPLGRTEELGLDQFGLKGSICFEGAATPPAALLPDDLRLDVHVYPYEIRRQDLAMHHHMD